MEKLSFVKNGVLRLPPGFRFHPTDEELVVQYLKRKVFACPMPFSIIPDFDVCKSDPWDLPGILEQERYFFSMREAKYPNGNRSNRATGSGYWKATGLDKQIVASKSGNQVQVVGLKKTLVFYRGKPPRGSRTDWIMHEYRLLSVSAQTKSTTADGKAVTPMENWVLCRIFLKKRGNKSDDKDKDEQRVKINQSVYYDFMNNNRSVLNLIPSSSSSDSSGITEVSMEDKEESRSYNSSLQF